MTTAVAPSNDNGHPALEADASQDRAVELVRRVRFAIVTGGPGTGKTTVVRRMLDELGVPASRVELAAPTGKAAKRMAEATGRDARTLHRLLGYHPVQGFTRTAQCPLEADLVIVDEASMIDVELAAALFDAIGPHTRLLLVGDADQLPSVGPGRVFADLVSMPEVPSVRLTQVHRSAAESWVARNAPRVLRGDDLELATTHDFRFVEVPSAGDALEAVCRAVEGDPLAQVLIPQRPGACGVEVANARLQTVLNPMPAGGLEAGGQLQRERYAMRPGDRVLQTRNDYKLGVYNGDVGEIVSMHAGETVVAYTDRGVAREVTYTLEQVRALELAYALTIHKSQGSEFQRCVVVCHSTHTFILCKPLLYTAITRTRGQVTLIGDAAGLRAALNSERKDERNTTLVERLRGTLDEVAVP